eukprot:9983-Heterococcus_DN1.PRE.8
MLYNNNSALDGIEVKIGKLGSLIHRVEHHLTGTRTATTAATTTTSATSAVIASTAGAAMTKAMSKQQLAATVLDSEELAVAATLHNIHTGTTSSSDSNQDTDSTTDTTTSSSSSGDSSGIGSSSTASDHIGTGPQLDMKAYSKFESTLEQLQVHPTDIVRTEDTYIGKGGFAKVYKVQLKGQLQLCAAKVVNIQELSIKQKQRMYLRFAKELFILHHLQHARIVPVYACATTLDELSIVMKYAQRQALLHVKYVLTDVCTCCPTTIHCNYIDALLLHCASCLQYTQQGSLRSILNSIEQWQEYTPVARHQILYDIAVGMAYLHEQNVFHRDLKSMSVWMYTNTTYYCCLHVVRACYYYNYYDSHNVLIDDDCRALLTDFGLSKTEGTISTSSTTKSLFHGGTLAWTAPELFNAVRGQTCTQLFTAKSDVYSYVRDQHSLSSSRVWNVNYQKATVVVTAIAVAVTVRAAVAVVAEVTVVAAVVVLCTIGVAQVYFVGCCSNDVLRCIGIVWKSHSTVTGSTQKAAPAAKVARTKCASRRVQHVSIDCCISCSFQCHSTALSISSARAAYNHALYSFSIRKSERTEEKRGPRIA